MFDGMERGELRTLYVIGENPAQSEADINRTRKPARRPRLHGRPGHPVHPHGRVRRRRVSLVGLLVRGRGHGDQLRAPSAARAQGARPAGPGARRRLDPRASWRADWASTGASRAPRRSGTSCARCRRCTAACATTGSRRWAASSGRAPTRSIRARRSCTGASGPSRSRGRARRSRSSSTTRRSTRSTPTTRCASRPAGAWSPTTPGAQTNRYRSPLHRGEALSLSPEDAEALLVDEGEIVRVSSAARLRRGARPRRPGAAPRPRLHDAPLPRAGGRPTS